MYGIDVATAQCSCGGEDDIMPEYIIEELPCAFTGYTLLHLSRALINTVLLHSLFLSMELMVREMFAVLESLVCPFQGDLLRAIT
ncbi:hypothetical protein HS088_TW15G00402 [Tripterygium wilfordii]|uniref:Uncharacterized protein n=1 Tax=Tripterygium wilfordii TaxID=458696 RepID=A0A7J7CLF7_TRIWF|nr:hypothetical protein HS088_TW15G00402 [Tripterygium wilfordii]